MVYLEATGTRCRVMGIADSDVSACRPLRLALAQAVQAWNSGLKYMVVSLERFKLGNEWTVRMVLP
jgi:hypothetical protein